MIYFIIYISLLFNFIILMTHLTKHLFADKEENSLLGKSPKERMKEYLELHYGRDSVKDLRYIKDTLGTISFQGVIQPTSKKESA